MLLVGVPEASLVQSVSSELSCAQTPDPLSKLSLYGKLETVLIHGGVVPPPLNLKVTTFEVSTIFVMGAFVLAPAQDSMLGIVTSVKLVFDEVPGKGVPPELIVPYELGVDPGFLVALAQTGYIFCG